MRIVYTCLFAGLLVIACSVEKLEPVGELNPMVKQLEQNNWVSHDTLISLDPQTFEETIEVTVSDYSPDTLRDGRVVFKLAEYMPIYAQCDTASDPAICTQSSINAYVQNSIDYPRWARVRGYEGAAIATFLIDEQGQVRDPGVERSMGDEFDKIILTAIEKMPNWHPAFHGGKPVAIRYKLPLTFSLPRED